MAIIIERSNFLNITFRQQRNFAATQSKRSTSQIPHNLLIIPTPIPIHKLKPLIPHPTPHNIKQRIQLLDNELNLPQLPIRIQHPIQIPYLINLTLHKLPRVPTELIIRPQECVQAVGAGTVHLAEIEAVCL